jgi:acyl carrier protein
VTTIDSPAFCRNLEDLLELPTGLLTSDQSLSGVWDSVALMGFLAMADQKYGATIPPKRISNEPTVEELAGLVQEFGK